MRDEHCDLCIVGGGYTGLWTAVIAKERDPSRDVVLIDKGEVGGAASGRNGGFMEASITHGVCNGIDRHPDEIDTLEELGLRNLNDIEATIERYSMDCDYERNGVIDVAHVNHPPSYLDELREEHDLLRSLGQQVRWLDQDAMRAEVELADLHRRVVPDGTVRRSSTRPSSRGNSSASPRNSACGSTSTPRPPRSTRTAVALLVTTPLGNVRCAKVVLGTNADRPLLKRLRQYMMPVYDYCLVTEPLSTEQLATASAGPTARACPTSPTSSTTTGSRPTTGSCGAATTRSTSGDRRCRPNLESRPETWAKLSAHFFETFPQLDDVKFTHTWGGAIDTSTRFSVFFGTAMSNRVVYAVGYTGLGVAATQVRRVDDARPARRQEVDRHPDRLRQGRSRCRSRPSRSGSSGSRRRAGRWTARTRPASAMPGCAPSTGSVSASTP